MEATEYLAGGKELNYTGGELREKIKELVELAREPRAEAGQTQHQRVEGQREEQRLSEETEREE